MKNLLLLALLFLLLGILGNDLNKERPEWFLSAITRIPFFNTEVDISFNQNQDGLSEENIHSRFHNLFLVCANEPSDLGDRVCWTHISKFNGIKAEMIAFFFIKDKYRHLRVSFPNEEHGNLLSYLNANFKLKTTSKGSKEKFGQDLGIWFSKTGTLSAYRERPLPGNLNLLLWSRFKRHDKLQANRVDSP